MTDTSNETDRHRGPVADTESGTDNIRTETRRGTGTGTETKINQRMGIDEETGTGQGTDSSNLTDICSGTISGT